MHLMCSGYASPNAAGTEFSPSVSVHGRKFESLLALLSPFMMTVLTRAYVLKLIFDAAGVHLYIGVNRPFLSPVPSFVAMLI